MKALSEIEDWSIVSKKKCASYAVGILIGYHMGVFYATYVFFFYEVEVGLPVMLVALSFIIFAIWNMVNDPLLGYLTDRPFKWTKKWGMRFPWIIMGIIPSIICFFLIFTPPDIDARTNPWPIFWYMVIITCLYDTCVSLFSIHLGAGFAVHFRTDFERRRASVYTNIIPNTGSVFIGLIPPLIIIYGVRSTILLAVLLVLLILSVGIIFLIPGIRETDDIKERFLRGHETERPPFWALMKTAFRHKNFVVSTITYTLYITAYTLYLASGIYFMKDILGLPYRFSVYVSLASFVGFTSFIPIWAKVAKRIGHVKTYTLGCLLVSITLLPSLWITTLWEAILYTFIGGAGFGCFYIMLFPIASDCFDEVTVDIGKHQEAILSGIRQFFFRIAIIIQGLVIASIHIITNYNPDPNAVQGPLAIWGIRVHMALIPSLLMIVAFFIMLKFYDLKGEKKDLVKQKLKELGL